MAPISMWRPTEESMTIGILKGKEVSVLPPENIHTNEQTNIHTTEQTNIHTSKQIFTQSNKQIFIQTSKQTNSPDGKCTFGSGQNQMTMTYISFTGWLRSLHCDVISWIILTGMWNRFWIMDPILTGIESCFESWIHFDCHWIMCWIMGPILTVHVNQVLWRVQCKFVFCYCEHGRSTQDPSGRLPLGWKLLVKRAWWVEWTF